MSINRGFLFTILVVATAAELVGNAAAATYIVGDNLGWTVPPNGPAAYTTWASQHVFRAGDILVFNFTTGSHDVAHVAKAPFDGCSSTNPIALATVGPASFTLNSTGMDYYICTFGQHCSLGQKLAINVTASSVSPAPPRPPSPPTTPTPSPTPTPIPIRTPTPTPTPSPSPSRTPSPSPSGPSPSGAPSPGSAPSPTPSGSVTPPPSPASESAPGLVPSPSSVPTGSLSPPPPPSSATVATISTPLVIFASITFGLMM